MANHFRHGGCACRHDRFSCCHRLQKHNPEAFLNTRQAEEVSAIILGGEYAHAYVTQPANRRLQMQIDTALLELVVLRPVPDDSNLELWNAITQQRSGLQQDIQALARIEPAD